MPRRMTKYPMPEQAPEVRRHNFEEVPLGYPAEIAKAEASRCLNCKKRPCVSGCPVGVAIPDFVAEIAKGNFDEAVRILKATNSLPAICGRVCPQESQCEAQCLLGKRGEPLAIGRLERFAADYERETGVQIPERRPSCGKKVAIVGSGPAGLTAGGELVREGFAVTIFEALHKPGGVLVYGIPEFRLPKDIVQQEVDYIKSLGVNVETNIVVGRTITMQELLEEYDAVLIASGAGLPKFLGIPGENLNGVYSANEFLTRSNLMKAYRFPEYITPIKVGRKAAVIGAGNVAMDSARTALRLGAEEVSIVYRRSEKEIPARAEEIHHAREEGIKFRLLTNPVKILGSDEGWVTGLRCVKMQLGEEDDSGRRRPIPIANSEFEFGADTVILAISQQPNPLIAKTTPGLITTRWGTIKSDEKTLATSVPGVFAAGDIVTGAATVIEAMGAGKLAARSIMQYVDGKLPWPEIS